MNNKDIEKIINNVKASLNIEDIKPSQDAEQWTKEYLQGKISADEVRKKIMKKYLKS
jgi:hypothetical protein